MIPRILNMLRTRWSDASVRFKLYACLALFACLSAGIGAALRSPSRADGSYVVQATAITPITSLSAALDSTAFCVGADRIDVYVRSASGDAVINLVQWVAADSKWYTVGSATTFTGTAGQVLRYVAKRDSSACWHVYKSAGTATTAYIEAVNMPGGGGASLGSIEPASASSSGGTIPAASGAGKTIYDNGSAYVALAAGTSSQVYRGGSSPSWGAVPAAAMPSLWLGLFGDGSDGDVTISGSTTLSREMNYNNLTIASSGSLNTGGFIVKVKGTLTIDAGGLLHRNGNTATTSTGAAALSDTELYGGGSGGNGNLGAGSAGGTSTASAGGSGGNGGGAASGGGGGGGATAPTANQGSFRSFHSALRGSAPNLAANTPLQGGGGGGGGGGSGTSNQGGGGGGGGGVVLVHANAIANSGSIEAKGGNGAPGQSGNSGGGGGGGGGAVYLLYGTYGGSGTILVTGGTGGAGLGTGTTGSAGSTGNAFSFGAWS